MLLWHLSVTHDSFFLADCAGAAEEKYKPRTKNKTADMTMSAMPSGTPRLFMILLPPCAENFQEILEATPFLCQAGLTIYF
jgi:hypothetical protein